MYLFHLVVLLKNKLPKTNIKIRNHYFFIYNESLESGICDLASCFSVN